MDACGSGARGECASTPRPSPEIILAYVLANDEVAAAVRAHGSVESAVRALVKSSGIDPGWYGLDTYGFHADAPAEQAARANTKGRCAEILDAYTGKARVFSRLADSLFHHDFQELAVEQLWAATS